MGSSGGCDGGAGEEEFCKGRGAGDGEVEGEVFGCEDEAAEVGACGTNRGEGGEGFCGFDEGEDFEWLWGIS